MLSHFASKKFTVTILGAVLIAVLAGLNKRFSLGIEPADLATLAGLIATYVASQAYADAKTEGATSGTVAANAPDELPPPAVKP